MPSCRISKSLVRRATCGLLLTVFLPAAATAGDFLGLRSARRCEPAVAYSGPPQRMMAVPLGSPWLGGNVGSPTFAYGLAAPTFNWGYFGAQHGSACYCHRDYYGDLSVWHARRSY